MATRRNKPPADLFSLAAALANGSPKERRAAAGSLGSSGDPAAVPVLVERLALEDRPPVTLALIGALGRLPVPAAAAALVALLRRPQASPALAAAAASALGSMGELGAAAALTCLDDAPAIVLHAVRVLGATGSRSGVAPLAALRRDAPALPTRLAAIEALGRIDDERAVAALLDALRDDRDDALKRVAQALVQQGARGAAAVAPLLRAGGELAGRAAYVLSFRPAPDGAVADLVALLLRRDTVAWAIGSLAQTDGGAEAARAIVPAACAALGGRGADACFAAAATLAWLARATPDALDDAAVAALLGALSLPDYGTRTRAAEALVALAPRAEAELIAQLRSDDANERQAAASVLAQRPAVPLRAAGALADLLADEGSAVWAAEALGRLGAAARKVVEAAAQRGGEGARRAERLLAR